MTDVSFSRCAAENGTFRLAVTGDIDLEAPGNSRQLSSTRVGEPDVGALILDLDHMAYVDSIGIKAFIDGHALATAQGTCFRVENPRPIVHRVLHIHRCPAAAHPAGIARPMSLAYHTERATVRRYCRPPR